MTVQTDPTAARSIFAAAIKLTDDSARQAFVELACREDETLRADVQALLAADAGSSPLDDVAAQLGGDPRAADPVTTDTFITNTPNEEAFDAAPPLDVAKQPQIGPYKIREQIGEGGMGYVYVAEQTEPVRRKVALKVIKPGMDTKEVIARFEAERQALAMMSHPNIAKVLDGGATDQGRPYFVMELVRGVPITQFCDEQKLSTRERLELFLSVCQAVQHAHMKGIIHRDLKPSNVLVELDDVRPVPKVIDFGVAKATGQQLSSQTIYTQFAQLVGTPLYMSPEQAKQSSTDIDTRSDIYSLGVLLYELLTGATPFDRERLSSVDATELRRIICEDDPPRPSARVSTLKNEQLTTIATSRKSEPRQLSLSLQRELDWIVMKALEKDRTRRYDSASALAADLQRYLDDEPVEACPPSVTYRLRKYAHRHKGLLTTAGLLILMLVTSTAVSGVFAVRANQARIASEESEEDAKSAQAEAEREKENAIAAQQESEVNLAAALDAIDKLLEHASSEELAEIPGAQLTRKKILEDVLAFYEDFGVTTNHPTGIQHRAAETWRALAFLARELGDYELAERGFSEAYLRLKQLATDAPSRSDFRKGHVSAALESGDFYVRLRESAEQAEPFFEEALQQTRVMSQINLESEVEHSHDSWQRMALLAKLGLAEVARQRGAFETRRILLLDLAEQRDSLGDSDGFGLAELDFQLAKLCRGDDPARAGLLFRRLASSSRQQMRRHPVRAAKSQHVRFLNESINYFRDRDSAFAVELACEALTIAEDLVLDFPGIPFYEDLLSQALSSFYHLARANDDSWITEQLGKHRGPSHARDAGESIERVARFIEQFPDRRVYYLLRARLFMELREMGNASRDIHQALQLSPSDIPLHRAHAWALYHGENRVRSLTAAIEEFPEIGQYYHLRGATHKQSGDLKAAIADFERALQYDDSLYEKWHRSELLKAKAGYHYERQEYQESLACYTQAIPLSNNAESVLKQRALVHFRLGNHAETVSDLERVLDLNANAYSVLWSIPPVEVATCPDADFRQAIRTLADRVVLESDRSTEALVARAPLLIQFGDRELAAADLTEVAQREDASAIALYHAGLLWLGHENLGLYAEICERVVNDFVRSDDPQHTHFAAWTCALAPDALDDYELAIWLARHALETEPASQQYITGLGAILLRAGRYDEAKEQLEQALAAGESEKTSASYTRYFLAMTEHHLGNASGAHEQLDAANASAEKELAGHPAWNRKLTLELLRKEAEALIEPAEDDDQQNPSPAPQDSNDE